MKEMYDDVCYECTGYGDDYFITTRGGMKMRLIDESLWNAAIYAVEYLNDTSLLRKLIAEAEEPTIEADDMVKVVRCGDCKSWKRNVWFPDSPNGICVFMGESRNKDEYCSYGKRR